MENVNLYLLLLLAGIIIGGAVAAMLALSLLRPFPPQPYVPYAGYAAPPAGSGAGSFLLLLALGIVALLLLHQWKDQQTTTPAGDETRTENPYRMAPAGDFRYTGH